MDTLNIQIENINDAPVLAVLINMSTDEDIPLVFTLSAEDLDGDILTFTAESDNENVTTDVAGDHLTLTPAPNWSGTVGITVTVSDEDFSDSEQFELTVTPVNDAPVVTDIPDETIVEGGTFATISLNEFVAYGTLGSQIHGGCIGERAIIISTYALCGFANFSSIGIQIGGISAIAPSRKSDLAKVGLKAMFGGAIASWLTATIAGIFI